MYTNTLAVTKKNETEHQLSLCQSVRPKDGPMYTSTLAIQKNDAKRRSTIYSHLLGRFRATGFFLRGFRPRREQNVRTYWTASRFNFAKPWGVRRGGNNMFPLAGTTWRSVEQSFAKFWLLREEGTNCSHLPDRFEVAEYRRIAFNENLTFGDLDLRKCRSSRVVYTQHLLSMPKFDLKL